MSDEPIKAIASLAKTESGQRTITIPVEEETLGEFISGLLGQPQSIQRELSGTFDINHEWLMNVHHLIQQRVQQQHNASFVDFSAVIFFQDGLSRKLTSIESFQSYNEPKPLVSNGVKLKWTYLIQFPGKNIPERQEISLFVTEKIPKDFEKIFSFFLKLKRSSKSVIAYQIDHTERTWGDDMENLLREHIKNCFISKSSTMELLQILAPLVGMLFFLGCFFGPVIINYFIDSELSDKAIEQLSQIPESANSTIEEIKEKVNFLISIQDPILKKGRYIVVYALLSIILGFIIMLSSIFISDIEKPSFVVVTDAAIKNRKNILQKNRRTFTIAFTSFLVGIATSVTGNYIYYYLSK